MLAAPAPDDSSAPALSGPVPSLFRNTASRLGDRLLCPNLHPPTPQVSLAHREVVGSPVLGAAVFSDRPEHLYHSVGLQMYYPTFGANRNLPDGDIAALIRVHQTIAL